MESRLMSCQSRRSRPRSARTARTAASRSLGSASCSWVPIRSPRRRTHGISSSRWFQTSASDAAGLEHPGDLGEGDRVVEPVEGLRGDDDVDRAVLGGEVLGRGDRGARLGHPASAQHRQHPLVGVGGEHVVALREQLGRELAGARADLEDAGRLPAHQPSHRVGRVAPGGRGRRPRPPGRTTVPSAPRGRRSACSSSIALTLPGRRPGLAWAGDRRDRWRSSGARGSAVGVAAARDGIDAGAARPRAAPDHARRPPPSRCCAARTRARCWTGSAATLDEVRAGAGDAVAQDAVRLSTHLLGTGAAAAHALRSRRWPGCTRSPARPGPDDQAGRPADAAGGRPAAGGRAAARGPDGRAGAAAGRGRARAS